MFVSFAFVKDAPTIYSTSAVGGESYFHTVYPVSLVSAALPIEFRTYIRAVTFISKRVTTSVSHKRVVPLFVPSSLRNAVSARAPLSLYVWENLDARLYSDYIMVAYSPNSDDP